MEKVDFLAADGIELNGMLYSDSKNMKNTKKIVISIHGMSSNCFKKREDIIQKKLENVDYLCFNNRGSELVKYIKKTSNNTVFKSLGGSTYEDALDGYYDILGAINYVISLGYTDIYLQGHSLGCTKIVYTYTKLKEENNNVLQNIKGIILLSLIDIVGAVKVYSKDKYSENIQLAVELSKKDKHLLMPLHTFIHPISSTSYLRYTLNSKSLDFAGYGRDDKLDILNNINIPLFMRWGNVNEMIIQKADELVSMLNNIITNKDKDLGYIDGADHGYTNKEELLASEINQFLKNKII